MVLFCELLDIPLQENLTLKPVASFRPPQWRVFWMALFLSTCIISRSTCLSPPHAAKGGTSSCCTVISSHFLSNCRKTWTFVQSWKFEVTADLPGGSNGGWGGHWDFDSIWWSWTSSPTLVSSGDIRKQKNIFWLWKPGTLKKMLGVEELQCSTSVGRFLPQV